jgi:hypothetical protein
VRHPQHTAGQRFFAAQGLTQARFTRAGQIREFKDFFKIRKTRGLIFQNMKSPF